MRLQPNLRVLAAVLAGLVAGIVSASDAAAVPLRLVHYMPWYASQAVSGRWGWHWTMGHFDPERVRPDGTREVASHDYPLIGAYDSSDPDALECQVLLMKLAGLDGVAIDWYGRADFNDYALVHRNTEVLIPWLRRAGLRFAICYEDQSVGHMVKAGALRAAEAREHGRQTLRWLDEHWFADPAYVRQEGRPVLLVFGPQHFAREDWGEIRAGLTTRPVIFALPHRAAETGADGAFGWPPVTGGKTLAPTEWQQALQALYARRLKGEAVIAVAFPGYRDIYRQAGLHDSYGAIAERDGATLTESLALAHQSGAPLIQIATWNDYGEGTVVEPTRNFGFRYLEILQRQAPRGRTTADAPTAADLRLPVRLYHLRKKMAGDPATRRALDAAAELLFAGRWRPAARALAQISGAPTSAPAAASLSGVAPIPAPGRPR